MTFINAKALDQNSCIDADVCIVGGGAAGITLARELAGQPYRVVLLESGDLRFRHPPQFLYLGENVGTDNFSTAKSRHRMFGGSTYNWAGQCAPMQNLDFEKREWIPKSGWPFDFAHLEPYYRRAQSVCRLGRYDYTAKAWGGQEKILLPVDNQSLETLIYQFSHPLNFGEIYHEELANAGNVDIYLNANAIDIVLDAQEHKVSSLSVATLNGRRCAIRARVYVLAAGGIENPRLLLASNRTVGAGIGNQYDLVGRYFMDHPYFFSGYYEPAHANYDKNLHVIEDYGRMGWEQRIVAGFSLSEKILRKERLNGCAVYFIRRPNFKSQPEYFSPASKSLQQLVDVVMHNELPDGRLKQHLGNITTGFKDIRITLARRLAELGNPQPRIALRAALETRPYRASRISLSDRRDHLGMPRVQVDWQLDPQDLQGLIRLHEIMKKEFHRLGLGELVIDLAENESGWPSSMSGGKHHMGTTRMHVDPKCGVVDSQCRVHDVTNLFIAGSSVFPTASFVNPTFTIVALAIRLADHLKENWV